MKLYFECFSGISGNMFIGSLLDLGVPFSYLKAELAKLPLDGYELIFEQREKNGIRASYFNTKMTRDEHVHRTMKDIRKIFQSSGLSKEVREIAKRIFQTVAEAEGKVHGMSSEEVHFHEVGAVDSVIDAAGAGICLEYLGFPELYFSPLSLGFGYVEAAHGLLPIPAPATAEILAKEEIPVIKGPVEGELVTPTGAAIVAALSRGSNPGVMKGRAVGRGAGTMELSLPNILRVTEFFPDRRQCLLEVNYDDMTGEELGALTEELWDLNPRDVFWTPIYMKKGRPGYQLSVLCEEEKSRFFEDYLFQNTSTLGLRKIPLEKKEIPRRSETVLSEGREYGVKIGSSKAGEKVSVEYEDLKHAARESGDSFYHFKRDREGNIIRDFHSLKD